jgi:predicted secreted hydrolase
MQRLPNIFKMKKLITLNLLLMISITILPQSWKTYPYAPAGSLLSFPADEGRHSSEPIEWWYTSGHLTGITTGKHYSYMLSYFYSPLSIFDGFRILNLSDDDLGLFYTETKALNYNIMASDCLNIKAKIFSGGTETWHNKTDILGNSLPFEYEISAVSSSGAINLEYDALKPPLILADSGYFYEGATDYTYYYSQTKNEVTGTITLNGITENVSGSSWIDRQYGTFNPWNGQEYEWFCIQLSNGMDINITNLFTVKDEIPDNLKYRLLSAYVDETTQYTTSDFQIVRLKYSYMPDRVRCYSQKWRITSSILNVDIIVSTLHSNCEVSLPFRFYEGSTNVTGTVNGANVTGVGFVELLHSYENPDISITDTTNLGDVSSLLTWKLNNPDDGNPLKYDLEYSIDSLKTFLPIITNVADTFYYWNTQALSEEKNIWLKVTGYSIDSTLNNISVKKLKSNLTAVTETEYQEHIIIYPNPSAGQFIVEGENIRKIEIIDIIGRTVYSSLINQTRQSIDLSTQQRGIYFVEVTTNRGTTINKLILE